MGVKPRPREELMAPSSQFSQEGASPHSREYYSILSPIGSAFCYYIGEENNNEQSQRSVFEMMSTLSNVIAIVGFIALIVATLSHTIRRQLQH